MALITGLRSTCDGITRVYLAWHFCVALCCNTFDLAIYCGFSLENWKMCTRKLEYHASRSRNKIITVQFHFILQFPVIFKTTSSYCASRKLYENMKIHSLFTRSLRTIKCMAIKILKVLTSFSHYQIVAY